MTRDDLGHECVRLSVCVEEGEGLGGWSGVVGGTIRKGSGSSPGNEVEIERFPGKNFSGESKERRERLF